MDISTFYSDEYIYSAAYQTYRSIGNFVDGLKPGSRKVVYAVKSKNIHSKIKVSQLQSKVAEVSLYLHGEQSLYGIIVGMAQNYVCSNNVNILEPDGNFGSRFIPEAAANRYIYTYKSKYFDYLFKSDDDYIIENQVFEGEYIEPKQYIPILPLLLINGSQGIGNGYAQKILPRDVTKIVKEIKNYLKDDSYKLKPIQPSFKGYNGTISKNPNGSWTISGKFERVNSNNIKITEVPYTYDLKSYMSVLDQLVDDKTIKGYIDKSENDNFSFNLIVSREFTALTDSVITSVLGLSVTVNENFTCIGIDNSVQLFESELDILYAYIKYRKLKYNERKQFLLEKYNNDLSLLKSKVRFIDMVCSGKLEIRKQSVINIEKELKKVAEIIAVNDTYNYLFNMPLNSLTIEKKKELEMLYDTKKSILNDIKSKTVEDMWIEDIDSFIAVFK